MFFAFSQGCGKSGAATSAAAPQNHFSTASEETIFSAAVQIDMARDFLRRSHVLVVCGDAVDESMKNDIAIAERMRITATTLDGILTVKGQGRMEGGRRRE